MKKKFCVILTALIMVLTLTAYAADTTGLTAQGVQQYQAVLDELLSRYPARYAQDQSGALDWKWEVNTGNVDAIAVLRAQLDALGGTAVRPGSTKITLDGKQISLAAYEIDGNNYFKLRDLAMVLSGTGKQFSVSYDAGTQRITLALGEAYTPVGGELVGATEAVSAKKSAQALYINGSPLSVTVYEIGGNNYFKLRDLGQALDFGVTWDQATGTVGILTTAGYESASAPAAAGQDAYATLTDSQKRGLNVFLTYFSQTYFNIDGTTDEIQQMGAGQLIGFAFRYNDRYVNNTTYSSDYLTASLSADIVDATISQFFGRTVPRASAGDFTYANGRYSTRAATGEGDVLSIASSYAPIGNGDYQVSFTVYSPDGPELPYDYDCFALSKAQADKSSDFVTMYTGTAVVRPAAGDTWQLVNYSTQTRG